MELGILAGVGAIGYLLSQRDQESKFKHDNNQPLQNYLVNHPRQYALAKYPQAATDMSCADSYPLYRPEYVSHQQRNISGLPNRPVGPVGPKMNKKINTRQELLKRTGPPKTSDPMGIFGTDKESFTNFLPANDPTNDMLLDMKTRPITDFYHNNMVPFFGSEVRQNMAGTGVEQGNYVDGIDVNSGFDRSTPLQTTLAYFTGNDDTYLHKREVGPFFSPAEQQTGWVYGMPNFRPDKDRYTQGLNNYRNDLQPVEPQMVGPGLNLDPTIPASGGFHDFTRILPNNVNDYKANQLPGQVITGKYFSAELPTSYPGVGVSQDLNPFQDKAPGVVKNRPDSFWDQTRYPTMTTKAGFTENLDYNIADYQSDFRPNNNLRDSTSYGLGNLTYKQTSEQFTNSNGTGGQQRPDAFRALGGSNDPNASFGGPQMLPQGALSNNTRGFGLEACVDQNVTVGQGPLGAHIPQTTARSDTFMSQDNNIRSLSDCSSWPTGNPARPDIGHGNIMANYYVNETDRGTVFPTNLLPLQSSNTLTSFWTYDDNAKTTTRETTEVPFAGNVSREKDGVTFYTYDDLPRTSTRETTQVPFAGNVSREKDGVTFWTYEDELRSTTKESTQVPFAGNVSRQGEAMMNRFQYEGTEIEVPI